MAEIKAKKQRLKRIQSSVATSVGVLKLVWDANPWLLLGNVISFVVPTILPFVNIYIYKLIIDAVVTATATKQVTLEPILFLVVLRFFTSYLQDISYKLQTYFNHVLWLKIPMKMSELVFGKLNNLDLRYFEDSQFKKLLKNIDETYRYRTLNLLDFLMYSLQSLVQLLIASIAIATVHWSLIIVVLFAAGVEFVYQLNRAEIEWGIWWGTSPDRVKFNYLTNILQDAQSIKEIKIFQLGSHFLQELIAVQRKFYLETRNAAKKNLLVSSGISLLSNIASIGIEVFIVFRALLGFLTVGDIGFYSGVVINFQNGISGLLRNIGNVFEATLYVENFFELLAAKPFVIHSQNGVIIDQKTAPLIEFKDVFFTYPDSKKATLKHFSLTIKPGEKIAFVGENGAGKSTIVKLLARFYDVDAGEILINGTNIKELDLPSWHQHIGVLFQDFNRYQHTATENIFFGNIRAEKNAAHIKTAAHSAGADAVIEKLTNSYDQMLGKTFDEGAELSTGQWQKIALARSFFRNAPILILDEPTAAIDAKTEAEIFENVEKLSKEKNVLIISHRFSTVRNADKIYVIDNGRILESGSHHQLMKKHGKYAQLFSLQAKGYQ